ncbi:hypothetical protein [Stomatohabitans albus]|uniref:hypothetical protein n=1 Tax=Stomatohabitans albus TaxID=3110766 RepID=UPI00300D7DF9
MAKRALHPQLTRLSAVDARIVAITELSNQSSINKTELSDLLWEATDLCLEISSKLCFIERVWADLDLLAFVWRRMPELVKLCRSAGVVELGVADIVRAINADTQRLFAASELVDDCQLDLLAKPDDVATREALLDAVDKLSQAGDRWFVHAFSSRFDKYFDTGYAVLSATEQRCIKERDALIAG